MLQPRLLMQLLTSLGIYLVFLFYPIVRLVSWIPEFPIAGLIAFAILQFIPYFFVAGTFILRLRIRFARSKILLMWLGISYLLFPAVLFLDVLGWLVDIEDTQLAIAGFGVGTLLALYAVFNAQTLTIRKIDLKGTSKLIGTSLVQLSDVHIGSRRPSYLKKIVKEVKALHPDYVAITGDLVDSRTVKAADLEPLREIDSVKFFTIGNHERYEECDEIVRWMRDLGFIVLRNETFVHNDIQFIGIDDTDSAQTFRSEFDRIKILDSLYRVLLFHRPIEYDYVSRKGIDLMVTGHTHHGQVFPFNLMVRRLFRYTRGTHEIGDLTLHVSTGTGTWGPILRMGSNNEVTQFVFV